MATKNNQQEHFFFNGMKKDRIQNFEESKTYFFGQNGRLYSHEGVLSFSSIEGTVNVMDEPRVIKYLGDFSFKDELIVIAKVKNEGEFNISSEVSTNISDITYPDEAVSTNTEIDFSDLYEIANDGYVGIICSDDVEEPESSETLDAIISITRKKYKISSKFWSYKICE